MKSLDRESLGNWIGFGLLGVTFLVSFWQISLGRGEQNEATSVVTYVHAQQSDDLAAAHEYVIRAYEEQNPGVQVKQVVIPYRIYNVWLRTQLVSGKAPDLMFVGGAIPQEFWGRYFKSLQDYIGLENPYNEGTPLEGVPWKNTFTDGLSSSLAFHPVLMDHYAIPLFLGSNRFYINDSLLQASVDLQEPPRCLDAFLSLCDAIRSRSETSGDLQSTIAGSRSQATSFINEIFASYTQPFSIDRNPGGDLRMSGLDVALGYLKGEWDFSTPSVRESIEKSAKIFDHFQSGFLGMERADALFYFAQGRSVFLPSGSWDLTNLRDISEWTPRTGRMPTPCLEAPVQSGVVVNGNIAEGSLSSVTSGFALNSRSNNIELAIDFLMFLTSYETNSEFANLGMRPPSVIGAPVKDELRAFLPNNDGYPRGFSLDPGLGSNAAGLYESNLYLLSEGKEPAQRFIEAMESGYGKALLEDLAKESDDALKRLRLFDSLMGAAWLPQQQASIESRMIPFLESAISQSVNRARIRATTIQRD